MRRILFIVIGIFVVFSLLVKTNAISVISNPGTGLYHNLTIGLSYDDSGHTGFARESGDSLTDFATNKLNASGNLIIDGAFSGTGYAAIASIPNNASFTLGGLGEKVYANLTGKPTNSSYTMDGLYEHDYQSLDGEPTSASYTMDGLSEHDYHSLTGRPTNASYTLSGLSEKVFANLTGKPTNASYTLNDLSEKNFSSLTLKPTTIAGYGITDVASITTFTAHIVRNDTHSSSKIASTSNIPTNASFTLTGLSEKEYANLTGKPTNASYTLSGLSEKVFANLTGKPTNASYTLLGLSEKNWSSLTGKSTTIASYGITDIASISELNRHIASSVTHGCTIIASAQALLDHTATYTTHTCQKILNWADMFDASKNWPWNKNVSNYRQLATGTGWSGEVLNRCVYRVNSDLFFIHGGSTYKSVDSGINWSFVGYAPFFPSKILELNGEYYALDIEDARVIYKTTDFENWNIITFTGDSVGLNSYYGSCVYDDKLWVSCGSTPACISTVWYSTDATEWTIATTTPGFSPRNRHQMLTYDDKMWIIGGASGTTYYNDVWYSTNGVNWTVATTSANFSPRKDFGSVVYDDKMIIIGGVNYSTSDVALSSVYSSVDGKNWFQEMALSELSTRVNPALVSFKNKLLVIDGYASATSAISYTDVWENY